MRAATADRQREAKRAWAEKSRKSGAEIPIPFPADPSRRAACLGDGVQFLLTYFPGVFYQGFTPDRLEMLEAIRFAATHGGDQAVAGPRGEGKTRLAIYESLRLMLAGVVSFPLLVTKNAGSAAEALDTLKRELETNELLAADFPEVCCPIIELDGWASRARKQHVRGHKPEVLWTKDLIALPTVPNAVLRGLDPAWREVESCARGQLYACVGIEGRIRGRNVRNRRPDLAIIDDVDDRESAGSEKQTQDRERIIDSDVAGLAGPGQQVARVMLCTLLNRRCVAYKFTDPKQKPSWKGKRLRAMIREPERKDLWEEYVETYRSAMESGDDPLARAATRFYETHMAAMDAGAEMSNPANYVAAPAEDGAPMELSSVQSFFNKVARFGWDAVLTEYQQDPPEEGGPESDTLTETMVRSRLTGLPRCQVPDGADLLTAFIDLGKRRLHWGVVAWEQGGIGSVIDYGEQPTADPDTYGAERAIRVALDEIADGWDVKGTDERSYPYLKSDGEVVPVRLCLVDSGEWMTTAYDFCRRRGAPFMPSKGQGNYHQPPKPTTDRKPGDRWFRGIQREREGNIWLTQMDPDHWKKWVHERFRTPSFVEDSGKRKRGSLALFGDEPKEHREIAKHVLAEEWRREFIEGKGWKEYWHASGRANHYFDVLYGNCVAASVCGIKLLGDAAAATPAATPRPSGDAFVRRPSGLRTLKVRR